MNRTLKSILIAPLVAGTMAFTSLGFAEEKIENTESKITIEEILKLERKIRNEGKLRWTGVTFKENERYFVFKSENNLDESAEITSTYKVKKDGSIGSEPHMIFYNIGDKSILSTNTGDKSIVRGEDGIYKEYFYIKGGKFS